VSAWLLAPARGCRSGGVGRPAGWRCGWRLQRGPALAGRLSVVVRLLIHCSRQESLWPAGVCLPGAH